MADNRKPHSSRMGQNRSESGEDGAQNVEQPLDSQMDTDFPLKIYLELWFRQSYMWDFLICKNELNLIATTTYMKYI